MADGADVADGVAAEIEPSEIGGVLETIKPTDAGIPCAERAQTGQGSARDVGRRQAELLLYGYSECVISEVDDCVWRRTVLEALHGLDDDGRDACREQANAGHDEWGQPTIRHAVA